MRPNTDALMDVNGSTNATDIIEEEDLAAILGRLDADFSKSMTLVYVYVVLVMVTGLLGNLLVVVVYVTKFKATTTRSFIVAMAAVDLVSCVIAMPMEIMDLSTFYTWSSEFLCKTQGAITAFTYLSSGYLALTVAVDRYRRICRPLKAQLTVRGANRAILACCLLAIFLTWPQVVVTGQRRQVIAATNLTATRCRPLKTSRTAPYPLIYYSLLFLQFTGGAVAMVTMYSIIAWKLRQRRDTFGIGLRKQGSEPSQPTTPSHSGEVLESSETTSDNPASIQKCQNIHASGSTPENPGHPIQQDCTRVCGVFRIPCLRLLKIRSGQDSEDPKLVSAELSLVSETTSSRYTCGEKSSTDTATLTDADESKTVSETENTGPSTVLKETNPSNDITSNQMRITMDSRKIGAHRSEKHDAALRSMTMTFFLVTLVYLLSFLPFFVVRSLSRTYNLDGVNGMAGTEILLRSLFFQSAANPLIYGIRHAEFRTKCKQVLKLQK